MTAACPLCRSTTDRVLATKLRRGTGTVFHCAGCDLGFLVGESDPERYSGAYRTEVSDRAGGGPIAPQEVFDAYRLYQGDRLRLVGPHLRPDSSVLEIGAGSGQFIHHLKDRCGRRCAIEPDPESRAFMAGMGIETEFEKDAKFDLVCAFQVLEHVTDPVASLRDVRDVLKPGGVAIIEVPNLHDPLRSVWANEAYEQFFWHSDHRFYFSSRSFGIAKALAGFAPGDAELYFLQDYGLLNHLHWHITGKPQATCHEGFAPVSVRTGHIITDWLTDQLGFLQAEYVERLKKAGLTANIAIILTV